LEETTGPEKDNKVLGCCKRKRKELIFSVQILVILPYKASPTNKEDSGEKLIGLGGWASEGEKGLCLPESGEEEKRVVLDKFGLREGRSIELT